MLLNNSNHLQNIRSLVTFEISINMNLPYEFATTNISFATWPENTLVDGILTPTYFRLTFKDALHRSVYLRNLGNHRPEISFMLHAQGMRERRKGAVSILSVYSPPFQDPASLSLSLSFMLFLSHLSLVHETFLVKSLRRFH